MIVSSIKEPCDTITRHLSGDMVPARFHWFDDRNGRRLLCASPPRRWTMHCCFGHCLLAGSFLSGDAGPPLVKNPRSHSGNSGLSGVWTVAPGTSIEQLHLRRNPMRNKAMGAHSLIRENGIRDGSYVSLATRIGWYPGCFSSGCMGGHGSAEETESSSSHAFRA